MQGKRLYNNSMFYFDDFNGYKVLRSDYLNDVNAFFTTRDNIPLFGFESDTRAITPIQTHSDHIRIVNEQNEYPDTDGLIINEPNILIYLRFADCTPLMFYDPTHKIGAISHAGWRGTAAKIGVKTVKKMVAEFGTKPSDIVTVIGPAIGRCCYEVSVDVKEKLLSTVTDQENLSLNRNIDLKRINARQLEEIGVEKIDICPYCTSCNNDLFYSYRKEDGTKERHYAVMII